MKPEIVALSPMPPGTLSQLDESFVMHRLWDAPDPDKLLAEIAPRVRAIATTGHRGADAAIMDRLPKAEIIACFGVGVDAVDLGAAKARGLPVTNTPDVLTDDVADLAIGLMLAAARLIVKGDRFVRAGSWLKGGLHLGNKVTGARLGILGMGRIGQAIAERAEGFKMVIGYHGPRQKPVPYRYEARLTDLAAESDYLVIACPGGPDTYRIVDAAVLQALGKKGTLINIARGSVVDEAALVTALQDGTLGAAALDVFEDEPRVPQALFALENVVLQPHQGSATASTRAAMGQLVVDNLRHHFAGKPLLTQVV